MLLEGSDSGFQAATPLIFTIGNAFADSLMSTLIIFVYRFFCIIMNKNQAY